MDDQILQIAFTVYHNPRAYALLLGSGISRSAGILTGQQIMEDLIRKVAHLKKQQIDGEPTKWYESQYHEKPGYDTIIKKLGGNPVDRSNILRKYFERQPNDEGDAKLPTRAHRAIATLIKEGYVQIILTTNFDRLLELALEEVGIYPHVITTAQDALNSPPLQHLPVTIVKLHGDYLESNIRNTTEELAKYDAAIEKLLDKVLSEWGAIICGWSGEYDRALRNGLLHSPKCHYATHWVSYQGDVKPDARAIIDKREGKEISSKGADAFFDELEQNVMALKSLDSINELLPAVAAERVRRLLATNDLIKLETWLNTEFERAYQTFSGKEFQEQLDSACPDWNKLVECVQIASKKYFEVLETPLHMVAALTWNGQGILDSVFSTTLSRWMEMSSSPLYFAHERLPILLLIYSVGIAAVERGHWQYLQAVLSDLFVSKRSHDDYSNFLVRLFVETFWRYPLDGNQILSLGKPLHMILRPVFQSPLMASDERYNRAFDLFELFFNLAYLASPERENDRKWMPHHETFLRDRSWDYISQYLGKVSGLGDEWGLLQIEPFKGDDFKGLLKLYHEALEDRKKYVPQLRLPPNFSEFYKPFRPEILSG